MYTYDTETSYNRITDEAWIWSWATCDEDLNVTMGDGTNVVKGLTSLPHKSDVWVHNLSYDGEFLLWEFVRHGYKIVYDLDQRDAHHGVIEPRQDLSGIMSMTIWTRGSRVTLHDSFRIFRCKLEKLPKTCGFEDLDVKDDAIDYDVIRPRDHVKTPDEESYQLHDVTVLMRAMLWIRGFASVGNTVGGIAMGEFKATLGKRSPFKPLSGDDRARLRSLYNGGIVYCPPSICGKSLTGLSGKVYDRNSMYPAECMHELPCAVKAWHLGVPKIIWSGCWAVHVVATGLLLRQGAFPYIITPFTGGAREYIPVLDKWYFCEEWQRIREAYDIEQFDVIESVEFDVDTFAVDFVTKWYEIKQLNDGRRTFAKFVLNNITGKWGENSQHEQIRRVVTAGGFRSYRYNEYDHSDNPWIFMPAVARVTSCSHLRLADAAAACGMENLLYTDTDSVHVRDGSLPDDMVDDSRLGAWKVENCFDTATYIKPKSYVESLSGEVTACKHAGINDSGTVCDTTDPRHFDDRDAVGRLIHDTGIPIGPDNMRPGAVYYTNQHKHVKGGVAIVRTAKRM